MSICANKHAFPHKGGGGAHAEHGACLVNLPSRTIFGSGGFHVNYFNYQ